MGWNIWESFKFSVTHMMFRSASLQILYREVQCVFLTPGMVQSKANGLISHTMLILHIFSLHILSCDLPCHTDSMRHNTPNRTNLLIHGCGSLQLEVLIWVGCLDITFPDEEGKQFSIKTSYFCALSMIIVSASRNPLSNLLCVCSEYHQNK